MRIDDFRGEHRWLSNFWMADVTLDGVVYPTVEHAFQAAKTLDRSEREGIRLAKTPGQAKRMGRQVALRSDWEAVKDSVMEGLVRQKFERNDYLRLRLLATEDAELVEGNTWMDTYWGMVQLNCEWKGQNKLGKILMKVRGELARPLMPKRALTPEEERVAREEGPPPDLFKD